MGALNFKLVLEYDGTAFHGWQSQRRERTVQAELQSALRGLTGQRKVVVIGAGRTDAGVHARGQVASVKLDTTIPPDRLRQAVNSKLPEDLRVRSAALVPDSCHAQRSATARRYSYAVTTATPVLGRQYVWASSWQHDVELLSRCAAMILGRHDFAGFAKANSDTPSTVCIVQESQWESPGPQLTYHVTADRFLHHMVRYLVGTMMEVARGHYALEQFAALLEDGPGEVSVQRAPASGLVLEQVFYPAGEVRA